MDDRYGNDSNECAGMVVANDCNARRAHVLAARCQQARNKAALLVTNHRGQTFPMMLSASAPARAGCFDRVLCDVPCSGDGTLRKSPGQWLQYVVASVLLWCCGSHRRNAQMASWLRHLSALHAAADCDARGGIVEAWRNHGLQVRVVMERTRLRPSSST